MDLEAGSLSSGFPLSFYLEIRSNLLLHPTQILKRVGFSPYIS